MKRNILIATVATTALIAGGTATAFAGADTTTKTTNTTKTAPAQPKAETTTTLEKATTATLAKTPGTITSAELDQHNDNDDDDDASTDPTTPTWELDVWGKDGKWHEVDVNAKTDKVTRSHTDADDDDRAPKNSTITVNEAAAAALKATPGTLTSIDLDDDGKLSWEAEVKGKDGKWHELNVDAKTAKVTHDQPDTDDDDDASDSDD